MDIASWESVDAESDRLIERGSPRKGPNEESRSSNESVWRCNERRREGDLLAWCEYFSGPLAGSLRARAEGYDQRAALFKARGEGIR